MNTVSMHEVPRAGLPLLAILGLLAAGPSWTQVPVDADGNPIDAEVLDEAPAAGDAAAAEGTLSPAELEELVGPIALYPDDLLAVVLPASAYPLQIVQAARFLEELEDDPDAKPDESWDDSVVALLNYPEVIEMMNEDLEWTYALGEAVVRQQPDVIAAIEAFRDRAYAAGNLKSDERQTVTREDGVIEIEPAEETVIYVPYYEPERVVVYQPEPVYHYYSRPYPVYYYPYPVGYAFHSGFFWGVTTAFHIGWLTDHVHVLHHSYWGHPYFGHTYYFGHWYRRPTIHVHNTFYVRNHVRRPPHHERDGDFWRPRRHSGGLVDRRGFREAYYTDRRTRTEAGFRNSHAERRLVGGDTATRARANREANRGASFARNRSGAALRDRERTPDADARRRADDNTAERDVIRFRPRDRADAARRTPDEGTIRFRARDRAGIAAGRDIARRAGEPEHRTVEPSPSRRVNPGAEPRERPSLRRDAAPATRRLAPPARTIERAAPPRAPSNATRSAPRVDRPSSRPSSSVARPAPRASRPSSNASRPTPRVSPPSRASRPAARADRPSSASSSHRAAPAPRSETRRPRNRH